MGWKEEPVSEQRLRFALEASKPGGCMTALCCEFGITRKTGYVWLRRYQEGGAADVLTPRSSRPHHSPRQASEPVVKALKAAREQRPDWGVRKLRKVMWAEQPGLSVVSISTLQRILDREGLIEKQDRQQIAGKRFERSQPNELWQMDFKGPQGFNQRSGPLSILDDYSRYIVALKQLASPNTSGVKATLQEAFEQYGLPEHFLVDHGKPWWDSVNVWGWTELTVWILRQGIRVYFSGIQHPQTQGKVERMHGALQRALRKRRPARITQRWLDEFRKEYNEIRPHEGIGMQTPLARWQSSPRKFNPDPGDWNYPGDWETKRLAGQGQLQYGGRSWLISRALRGQLVGLQTQGARVLVYYCQIPIRELDLDRGRNAVIPGNPFYELGRKEGSL